MADRTQATAHALAGPASELKAAIEKVGRTLLTEFRKLARSSDIKLHSVETRVAKLGERLNQDGRACF